eukprot:1737471-Rhodomonas_salina.1
MRPPGLRPSDIMSLLLHCTVTLGPGPALAVRFHSYRTMTILIPTMTILIPISVILAPASPSRCGHLCMHPVTEWPFKLRIALRWPADSDIWDPPITPSLAAVRLVSA